MKLLPIGSDASLVLLFLFCALLALFSARRAFGRSRTSQLRAWLVLLLALSTMLALVHYADERQQREELAAQQLIEQGLGVAWQPSSPAWVWNRLSFLTGKRYRHAVALSPELKSHWAHSDTVQQVDAQALYCIEQLPWLRSVELPFYQQHGGPFVMPRADDTLVARLGRLRRLEHLDLSGQPVSDDCLPHLLRLSRLRQLDLTGTAISASACAQLRGALPGATLHEP